MLELQTRDVLSKEKHGKGGKPSSSRSSSGTSDHHSLPVLFELHSGKEDISSAKFIILNKREEGKLGRFNVAAQAQQRISIVMSPGCSSSPPCGKENTAKVPG